MNWAGRATASMVRPAHELNDSKHFVRLFDEWRGNDVARGLFDLVVQFPGHVRQNVYSIAEGVRNIFRIGIHLRTADIIADALGQLLEPLEFLLVCRSKSIGGSVAGFQFSREVAGFFCARDMLFIGLFFGFLYYT